MINIKGYILQYKARAKFFHYLLRYLFKETVGKLYFNKYLNELKDHLYFLVDQFQYIFESKDFYNASSDFFRLVTLFQKYNLYLYKYL